ncbi:Uncharacterised protein [Edwardsiella ictaluri]|nr:Uncharacterised protein [Edwardsiella ictaluri]
MHFFKLLHTAVWGVVAWKRDVSFAYSHWGKGPVILD